MIHTTKSGKTRPRRSLYAFFVVFIILFACVAAALFSRGGIGPGAPVPIPTGENPNFLTQVDDCLIPTAAVYGYDLRITAAYRSITDQTEMYDQGRTIDGHIVSEAPPGHSLHNYGYAVDVVDRQNGYDVDWPELVSIGMFCHLESGGVGDLPHFEERHGLSTDQFAAGMRPPALALPCQSMENDHAATTSSLTIGDLDACGAPDFSSTTAQGDTGADAAAAPPAPLPTSITVPMMDQDDVDQDGAAVVADAGGGKTRFTITIGAESGSNDEIVTIYTGSCDLLGGDAYPLNDLVKGISTTTMDVPFSELVGQQEPLAIVVQDPDASSTAALDSSDYVSCGDMDMQ